ncbi:unnamed protein product [Rotaria sordida]|uniref:Uncharacterized protein n=1 Tax=Rotaria sordida TaxID=392033 RepID=A0A813RWI5_9BILA|nr:unnamed protein product [Rotaria sordida]
MLTNQDMLLSCTYCQTMACRCSSTKKFLNCSSYLLNLTYASNCANNMIIWEIVDFSSRNFESFDSTKLLSLRMYHLLLKSNLITTIDENTFDTIGNILIELDLQMNQLSNISSKWFNSKLKQLKILNLALNQLESFIELDHIHLPNLQELNLSWNQIEIFPYQIHQWKSLIRLDLSFNKLSSIPRYALMGLHNLTWLSLASNRNLTCIIQDSFKYLKSLKYLDLSSTNLFDLDGCIFIQLTGLRTLKIERVLINCSSCWLPIAKKNSIILYGQCLNNITIQRLDSLTNEQLHYSCSKSSIDCSSDYCEPGSFNNEYKTSSFGKLSNLTNNSNTSKNHTIKIILSIIFSIITLIIIIIIIILIYRWKQGKNLICCQFLSTTSSTMTEITRRHRRQHQKQIINKNPTIIESIVTHGTNMNVPPYPHNDNEYLTETTSNNKRKLYNPMFMNSPKSDPRYQQSIGVSNDNCFHSNQSYSENL